jgi:CBS domain-containing protein
MKVKDLMQTDIATLRTNDSLDVAEDIMGMGRFRHLPVVQANNRLVGIVSQRDLLRASVSSLLKVSAHKQQQWLGKVAVRDVMSKGVVAVEADADIEDALKVLLIEKFGCLPVIEKKKLVGILTDTDLLEYLQRLLREGKPKKKRPRKDG